MNSGIVGTFLIDLTYAICRYQNHNSPFIHYPAPHGMCLRQGYLKKKAEKGEKEEDKGDVQSY